MFLNSTETTRRPTNPILRRWNTMAFMKLPNADQAVVDIVKLRDYCLNPDHPRGRNKARVFASALGLTADDAPELQLILLNAIRAADAEIAEKDEWGQRYVVD